MANAKADEVTPAAQPSGAEVETVLQRSARLWRNHRSWIMELSLVVAMYYLYSALRSSIKGDQVITIDQASCDVPVPGGSFADQKTIACNHADDIEWLERVLRMDWELPLNRLFLDTPWLAYFGSLWYQLAHMLVTFGVLTWLFIARKRIYGRLRTALMLLWLVGLSTYWLYPLAPPRFALDGAIDSMDVYPILFSNVKNIAGLANLYAAMPSLHCGFAVWVAIALISAFRSRWRWLAILYPMTTTFVVMGTANHYWLDAVGGAIYAVGCWLLAKVIYRRIDAWRESRAATRQVESSAA